VERSAQSCGYLDRGEITDASDITVAVGGEEGRASRTKVLQSRTYFGVRDGVPDTVGLCKRLTETGYRRRQSSSVFNSLMHLDMNILGVGDWQSVLPFTLVADQFTDGADGLERLTHAAFAKAFVLGFAPHHTRLYGLTVEQFA
jgi:hypothetical protein